MSIRNRVFIFESGMPGSCASSIHAFRMGKVLLAAGLDPVILVGKNQGQPLDLQADGTYKYDGIVYIPVGESNSQGKLFRKIDIFLGRENPELCYLKRLTVPPLAVIIHGLLSFAFLHIRNWCRKNSVVFMPEDAEWNKRSDFGGKTMYWLDMEFRMRILQRLDKQIIVNNSFLEKYYANHGCNVLSMPSMLDTQDPRWMPKNARKAGPTLKLMFAGTPIRDRQDIILAAVLRKKREGLNVTIEYLGSTREKMKEMLPDPSILVELGNSVVFHGKVPFEQVPVLMEEADYAVMLREDSRWSRACFPSKITEFLSLGVPVICNLTSDLGDYLRDGLEAFLVNEVTVEAFAGAISRAAMVANNDTRLHMREQARRTAQEAFDIQRFSGPLGDFIRNASQRPGHSLLKEEAKS